MRLPTALFTAISAALAIPPPAERVNTKGETTGIAVSEAEACRLLNEAAHALKDVARDQKWKPGQYYAARIYIFREIFLLQDEGVEDDQLDEALRTLARWDADVARRAPSTADPLAKPEPKARKAKAKADDKDACRSCGAEAKELNAEGICPACEANAKPAKANDAPADDDKAAFDAEIKANAERKAKKAAQAKARRAKAKAK